MKKKSYIQPDMEVVTMAMEGILSSISGIEGTDYNGDNIDDVPDLDPDEGNGDDA